ncbi:MAG: tetratricopeptide repeat protein [Gemmatimonadota bacterium]|jgi:tetratricopeptide (TPR) repeat protein|nr:tetratricopeptide repeat protein [Gemmatimonadota bacterium]
MSFSFLSSEEYDEQAHQLFDAGEYDQARELLLEGITRYPDAVDLHIGIGYVRLAREEYIWALKAFEKALSLDPDHEDAWVGRGETLLKFGRIDDTLECFRRVDDLGLSGDVELGLTMGRALYREALFRESRQRLTSLAAVHPDVAEVRAALGYTLHALGDDLGARREMRAAIRLDGEIHEVRIYLSHLHFERGDLAAALAELEQVPPDEHWDPLSVWRYIELKCAIGKCREDDPSLAPWRARWEELRGEPDPIDLLLSEVEAAFEEAGGEHPLPSSISSPAALASAPGSSEDLLVHRVRTADGTLFSGSWEEIVKRMRDALSDPSESIGVFMHRAAERARQLTGRDLPCGDAEEFIRESARMGLLSIEV